jgi:spoIIIJ-associated protein
MQNADIVQIVKDLSAKMGAAVQEVEVSEAAGHTLFTIRTEDSGALIGARGETLSALNHIVKKIVEDKDDANELHFVVDVNGYHLKHIKMLQNQANILAERARTFKYDVEMSPMSAYDRMIVHAALQGAPDVKTESEGDGKMRRVIIKYVANAPAA